VFNRQTPNLLTDLSVKPFIEWDGIQGGLNFHGEGARLTGKGSGFAFGHVLTGRNVDSPPKGLKPQ
jgi:hypothetical protein